MLFWCPHTTVKLILQELPGNSPTTLKKNDTRFKKNLKQQQNEQPQQFNNNNEKFHWLQKNLHKYKQPIDILQNNIIGWQIECKIS